MDELKLELPLVDMRGAVAQVLQSRMEEEARSVFDLERVP